jgi:hypothetical protein
MGSVLVVTMILAMVTRGEEGPGFAEYVAAFFMVGGSFYAIYRLIALDNVILAVLVGFAYVAASWKLASDVASASWAGGVAGILVSLMFWFLIAGVGGGSLIGQQPPMAFLLIAVGAFVRLIFLGLEYLREEKTRPGGGMHRFLGGVKWVVGAGVLLLVHFVFLGGDLAAWGQLLGGESSPVGSAIITAGEAAGEQFEAFSNTALNPHRNPSIARITCTWEMFAGGGAIKAAGGGAVGLSQCVQSKLGTNETETESERVTDPIVVRMGEIGVEPFSDHLNVEVPLHNTLVRDRNGRPIQIPAENVVVVVQWLYNGKIKAQATREAGVMQNGDTRSVFINECESTSSGSNGESDPPGFKPPSQEGSSSSGCTGQWAFKTFTPVLDPYTPDRVIFSKLDEVVEACKPSDDDSSCSDAVGWFTNRFDESKLAPNRVAFLVSSTDDYKLEDLHDGDDDEDGEHTGLRDAIKDAEGDVLLPSTEEDKRSYTIRTFVSYDYAAEAAFTQSSRWEGGNHLLEVMRQEVWQDMSLDERNAWRNEKCGEVNRYGQTIRKQRTAALTTPVVPVMYTDCGTQLFRLFDEESCQGGTCQAEVPISIGATVNEEQLDAKFVEDNGFTVQEATTDCWTGEQETVKLNKTSPDPKPFQLYEGPYKKEEGVGWTVNPATKNREVSFQGESQTIACKMNMDVGINLVKQRTYTIAPRG